MSTDTLQPQPDLAAEEFVAALLAERQRRRRPPRWARLALRALPRVLGIVTVVNGLIGVLAVLAPFARAAFGPTATAPLYAAFSLICPQRPSHTWFIAGQPMAMEQRMVAMYLAFGIAGLLYAGWSWARRPLPTWLAVLAAAPIVVDIVLSTAGVRPSTPTSRLWTGALCAVAAVWWSYPRFEAQARLARARLYPPKVGRRSEATAADSASRAGYTSREATPPACGEA